MNQYRDILAGAVLQESDDALVVEQIAGAVHGLAQAVRVGQHRVARGEFDDAGPGLQRLAQEYRKAQSDTLSPVIQPAQRDALEAGSYKGIRRQLFVNKVARHSGVFIPGRLRAGKHGKRRTLI